MVALSQYIQTQFMLKGTTSGYCNGKTKENGNWFLQSGRGNFVKLQKEQIRNVIINI